ncbi:MAG: hypothetical protein IIW14_00615 [Kiritimatiellae bacterium]|jgi:hypothetical protein|nr:hypothetical protein [Kiritimatiellia bacterium]
MKKLLSVVFAASVAFTVSAQEAETAVQSAQSENVERRNESAVWPACVAVSQWPRSPDVIGLRLTIPFSTTQDNVTGFDVGLWGVSEYFEGVQLNLLRSNVRDSASAFQVGIYNSVGRGDFLGAQVGLWNESMSMRGVQVGVVNVTGGSEGFQIGLINRAETLYGFQVGVINIIRDAELQFMPVVNIGF